MMVKRALVGPEQLEKAKNILKMGLGNIRGDVKNGEYLQYVHRKECTDFVSHLSRFIKFAFVKPSSGVLLEDKGFSLVLTPLERQEALENSYVGSDDVEDLSFYKYIGENSLDSKMNSEFGSIQVRFSVDVDAVQELGYIWDFESFSAVEVPFINFIIPYWFNFMRYDKYIVNDDSKPGVTVGEIATVLLEMGMSYADKEKDKARDLLFEDEMKFFLIDEIEGFECYRDREWRKGRSVIAALEKDSVLMLKSILVEPEDFLMDFPQGNSLISMAVKFKADNCVDFLLEKGVSLWRTPGGVYSSLSVETCRTIFSILLKGQFQPSFAWYQFFLEYMKKDVIAAKKSGRKISNLEGKVDLLVFQLILDVRWDRKFFTSFLKDFICSVLDEDEANACIVDNFYRVPEADDVFKAALKASSKKKLVEIILKDINNLYLIFRVVQSRKISASDVLIEGMNLRLFLESKFPRNNDLIKQITSYL